MKYDLPLFRPPSEAYSLIIQVTLGCSHNKCTFCSAFKTKTFKIRTLDEVEADLKEARKTHPYVGKIFLADGDALILPTEYLLKLFSLIRKLFPECNRIGIYGSAKAINRKTLAELKQFGQEGLGIIYLGLESGNDQVLTNINKGVTADETIRAGLKVKEAGIPLSITIISGMGSRELLREHALDTARVLNAIDPDYLGLLALMIVEGTPLFEQKQRGQFEVLTPKEIMAETKLLLENLELTNCVFRANHASNYYPLMGTLPEDKPALLALLDKIQNASPDVFKKDSHRLL
ncbi:MAG: radical SAM protein [Clostridia bacterium]|nr:radical SAM protein [Clostridia bacterium]